MSFQSFEEYSIFQLSSDFDLLQELRRGSSTYIRPTELHITYVVLEYQKIVEAKQYFFLERGKF